MSVRFPTAPADVRTWVAAHRAPGGEDGIFPHARTIAAFLHEDTPYRGLILFHDLGSGKTCTSIAAAAAAARPVAVMLPASLEANFVTEVAKCGPADLRKDQAWAQGPAPARAPRVAARNDRRARYDIHRIARRHGGAWEPSPAGTPYDQLTEQQQSQVREQLAAKIRERFTFVHYDGWAASDPPTRANNPFDGHVVIIDEAHRVASMVANKSEIARTVYDAVCHARDAKVILLTATPISNAACEIGALVNMARGATITHTVAFQGGNNAKVIACLKRHGRVDLFRAAGGTLTATFLPAGFARTSTRRWIARDPRARSKDPFRDLLDDLEKSAGLRPDRRTIRASIELPMPDDPESFDAMFLDDTGNLANRDAFDRAVSGTVSYVSNARRAGDFPALEIHHVRVVMSPAQYTEYVRVRSEELRREKQRAGAQDPRRADDVGDYRVLSRASCNFVFPADVLTKFPHDAQGRAARGERAKVQRARMGAIESRHVQTLGRLATLSPKMAIIADRIARAEGPCIVYSDFRTAEGAGAFTAALRALGHVEIRVGDNMPRGDKDALRGGAKGFVVLGGGDKGEDEALLRAFNGDWEDLPIDVRDVLQSAGSNRRGEVVRTLVITSSGAQGINTKNVREVHLLEPFWNYTRIDQVIGRAVRFRSHASLPPAERRVDAYLYISVFSEAQKGELPDALAKSDRAKTSDELVLEAAERKKRTVDQIYDAMRTASIDCGGIHNDAPCKYNNRE